MQKNGVVDSFTDTGFPGHVRVPLGTHSLSLPRAARSSGDRVRPHSLHLTATLLLWYNSGDLWDFCAAFVNVRVNLDKPACGMV